MGLLPTPHPPCTPFQTLVGDWEGLTQWSRFHLATFWKATPIPPPPPPPPSEAWVGTNPGREPKALHSSWLLGRAWPGKEADMPGIPKMHPCLSLCLLPQASRDSESRVGKESPAPPLPHIGKNSCPNPSLAWRFPPHTPKTACVPSRPVPRRNADPCHS